MTENDQWPDDNLPLWLTFSTVRLLLREPSKVKEDQPALTVYPCF